MVRAGRVVALALVLAGCGGSSVPAGARLPAPLKLAHPAQAIWCPTTGHAIGTHFGRSNAKVSRSFDTRVLLGQPQAAARAFTRKHGCSWRVVKLDGRWQNILADGVPNRVDVAVKYGIVTTVYVG